MYATGGQSALDQPLPPSDAVPIHPLMQRASGSVVPRHPLSQCAPRTQVPMAPQRVLVWGSRPSKANRWKRRFRRPPLHPAEQCHFQTRFPWDHSRALEAPIEALPQQNPGGPPPLQRACRLVATPKVPPPRQQKTKGERWSDRSGSTYPDEAASPASSHVLPHFPMNGNSLQTLNPANPPCFARPQHPMPRARQGLL